MKKELMNLFFFIAFCFVAYILFRNLNFNLREGMTDASGNTTQSSSVTNGVAGNAEGYAANVKSASIKIQDALLISKYRTSYENTILNLDELISNLMLQTTLNININNPTEGLTQLATLSQAQVALNNVMRFIDQSA